MSWFRKHKVITTVLVLVLLLILLVVGFIWSKLDKIQFADEIENNYDDPNAVTEPVESKPDILTDADLEGLATSATEPPLPDAEIQEQDHVMNVLLIGTDERTKKFNTNARSDSMIIVSINRDANTVKLVSLERGMGVPVLEGRYKGQYDWLTHIFRYGGADLLVKTVEECFRVNIDHYVRVNFTTVRELVDAVGGVVVDMNEREVNYFNTIKRDSQHKTDYFKVGPNLLDGKEALAYARLREIDSDWKRVRRQRTVIIAIVQALKDASLSQLNNLLDEMLPMIQTDFSKLEIAEWMLYAPKLLTAEFDQTTIPKQGTYGGMTGMGGRGLFAVDFEVNSQILNEFLYGPQE